MGRGLHGEINVPSDKSITHRAILFSSLAQGSSRVLTSVLGRDNLATIRIMRQLGVPIHGMLQQEVLSLVRDEGIDGFELSKESLNEFVIEGSGHSGLQAPVGSLDCGNSGTTARLLCGILAGQNFSAELNGDSSLSRRPFKRVVDPLSQMGARFSGDQLPFTVHGGKLIGVDFISPRASAQVKSAMLLAGLNAEGGVSVTEPRQSRDHTERMLRAMGCPVLSKQQENGQWCISLNRGSFDYLQPLETTVPGDFSAAAFFIVAASIIPDSEIRILNVGFNPTRIGLYHILKRMGAEIDVLERRVVCGEEVCDLRVKTAQLQGVEVSKEEVVLAIDEIPILAVAAAAAQGVTRIQGAGELRVKESDRLAMTRSLLESFSFSVLEHEDGLVVEGSPELVARLRSSAESKRDVQALWRKSGDHRIAMSGAVLEFLLRGDFDLAEIKAVETSFPNFSQYFHRVSLR